MKTGTIIMIADEVTEASIERIDAALAEARTNKLAAAKILSEARAIVAAAKAKRGELIADALIGKQIDAAELSAADAAVTSAQATYRFRHDVDEMATEQVKAAEVARTTALFQLKQHDAIRAEEAINRSLFARVPQQPTDAELLAEPPGLLARVLKEANDAYQEAYSHWQGPPAHPTFAPRQRVIQEGQDVAAWRQWAAAVGEAPGWQARSFVRQVRVAMAARDHFTKYTKLGLDDLRALNAQNYPALRNGLLQWNGLPAPCVFAPLKVA